MNYSKALNECIESAYMVASHFGARYLESWHLLIAMSNHSYSVAGATLNDYPYEMDRLEEVALELTETEAINSCVCSLSFKFSLLNCGVKPCNVACRRPSKP